MTAEYHRNLTYVYVLGGDNQRKYTGVINSGSKKRYL